MKKHKKKITRKPFSAMFTMYDKMFGEYIIVVNKSDNEVYEYLKRISAKSFGIAHNRDGFSEKFKGFLSGGVMALGWDKYLANILFLREFNDEWENYDILVHEVVHLKQSFFERRGIKDEQEFESYWVESTFRSIRKKIMNLYTKRLKK